MNAACRFVPIVSRRTSTLLTRVRRVAAALIAALALDAAAQTPPVSWAVSSYGPGNAPATLGCGFCASDQRSMKVDAAGNVIAAGFGFNGANDDWKVVKFNGATGIVMWEQNTGSAVGYDQAWGMTVDAAGNAILTGNTWNGVDFDIRTIKYAAADGAVVWDKSATGVPGGNDSGIAAITDSAGNVIVGGYLSNGANDDMKIIKYAAADGTVLWEKTFAGASNGFDYVYAIAVDGNGNVIVTGEEGIDAANSDWKTVKYAAADGAILWQMSFAGAAGGLDIPFSVGIDGANDVIVVGSNHNGTDFDAKIVKYAGTNGAVLWEKTFVGSGGGDDMFYSLALDGAGNAIATGFTFNGAAGNDWNTVKFRGTDGATLWAKNFGGSGNLSDVSVAVAVDAAGNAIVGGRVNNSADAANRDMQAVKFAAADGALLWSYTYAGGASGFDRVAAVATRAGSVFLAGESLETGFPAGWRIVKLVGTGPGARHDFNADLKSDILWRRTDGTNYVWHVNGAVINDGVLTIGSQGLLPGVPDPDWAVAGIGDFNGDGKADILWRHTNGTNYVWMLDGSTINGGVLTISSQGLLPMVDATWSVAGVGDFNGDGKSDILWRRNDGTNFVWHVDGATITGGVLAIASQGLLPGVDSSWSVVGVGDYNVDGKADILWRRNDGMNYVWHVDGATINGGVLAITSQGLLPGVDTTWSVAGVGDYNGDGKADILWRRNDGMNYVWHVDGTTINGGVLAIGSQGLLPSVTDSDWSVVGWGDYNGDGKSDVFWRHTNGTNYIWHVDGTVINDGVVSIGSQGLLPSVADAGWQVQNPK